MKKLLILFILCLFAVSCVERESHEIKIGAAGPFSGELAGLGVDEMNAIGLAVDEWNAKGGVFGKKIVIVQGDDKHDAKEAVKVANKMVGEGVVGVIGHMNSRTSISASAVYHKAGIPMISPSASSPKLTEQGFDNVFRVYGRNDEQALVAADFAVNVLKAKRIAVIHDKTPYGEGLADEFKKSIGNRAEILLDKGIDAQSGKIFHKFRDYRAEGLVYYGIGEKDYSTVVTAVKAANPDLVFFCGGYLEGGIFIKQFRAAGGTAQFLGDDAMMSQRLINIGGRAVEGTYVTAGPAPKDSPIEEAFDEAYREKVGRPLVRQIEKEVGARFSRAYERELSGHGLFAPYAYDATNILLQSIRTAGTGTIAGTGPMMVPDLRVEKTIREIREEAGNEGKMDRKNVIDAIRNIDYHGVVGHIRFDAKGDVRGIPYVLWQVKGGKFRRVRE